MLITLMESISGITGSNSKKKKKGQIICNLSSSYVKKNIEVCKFVDSCWEICKKRRLYCELLYKCFFSDCMRTPSESVILVIFPVVFCVYCWIFHFFWFVFIFCFLLFVFSSVSSAFSVPVHIPSSFS